MMFGLQGHVQLTEPAVLSLGIQKGLQLFFQLLHFNLEEKDMLCFQCGCNWDGIR